MASDKQRSISYALEGEWEKPPAYKTNQIIRFKCGSRYWELDIMVAMANSSVFWRLVANSERTLGTDDENVAAAVIKYLEIGGYEDSSPSKHTINTPMHHAKAMNVALTYRINGLGGLAYFQFRRRLSVLCWRSEQFIKTVAQAYDATSNDLSNNNARRYVRGDLVKMAKAHAADLMASGPEFISFKQLVRSAPDFAFDLLESVVSPTQNVVEEQAKAPEAS